MVGLARSAVTEAAESDERGRHWDEKTEQRRVGLRFGMVGTMIRREKAR